MNQPFSPAWFLGLQLEQSPRLGGVATGRFIRHSHTCEMHGNKHVESAHVYIDPGGSWTPEKENDKPTCKLNAHMVFHMGRGLGTVYPQSSKVMIIFEGKPTVWLDVLPPIICKLRCPRVWPTPNTTTDRGQVQQSLVSPTFVGCFARIIYQ